MSYEGSELVEDDDFKKFIAKMEDDADKAEAQWKSQSTKSDLADFPQGFMTQYKGDCDDMIKAQRDFNGEWTKIVLKRGSVNKLLSTHMNYTLNLGALQNSNARCEALLDVGVNVRAKAWILRLTELAKAAQAAQLVRELGDLKRELEKAKDEVTDAEVKRVLNVAISAVVLVVAPESAVIEIGVAAGGLTAHLLVDHAWGQSTDKGAAVFVAGDGPAVIAKLGEGVKKFAGAAAAVATFKFDSDEVAEAKAVVERIRPKLKKVVDDQDDFIAGLLPMSPKLRQLDTEMDSVLQEIGRAKARSYNAAKNYDAMKNAIKKAK